MVSAKPAAATPKGALAGTPSPKRKKAKSPKRKRKGKNKIVQPVVVVTDDYNIVAGLNATIERVIEYREAVKHFIGSLDIEAVLTADEVIQERLTIVKNGTVTKKAERNGVTIELLSDVGCKKQTNTDGSELFQWGDGTLIKHSDGVYVMKLPSGNVVQYNEKEHVKIFQNPDGVILQVQGSSDIVNVHDGSENEYVRGCWFVFVCVCVCVSCVCDSF